MTVKTTRTERLNTGTEKHSFGVADKKGRDIGAIVTYSTQVYEAIPDDSRSWCNVVPGTYLCVDVRATRAGETFGAVNFAGHMARITDDGDETAAHAEIEAYVAKYLKGAKARALKTAAK